MSDPAGFTSCSWQHFLVLGMLPYSVAACDADLCSAALQDCVDQQIPVASIAECLLQSIPYSGFPGVIEGFTLWHALLAGSGPSFASAELPSESAIERGHDIFERVYGKQCDRVLNQLERFHPQLRASILNFAYGSIMARSEQDLPFLELLGVSSLLAQGRMAPLYSHMRGALRSGTSAQQMKQFLGIFESRVSAARYGRLLEMFDRLQAHR